MDIHFQKTLPVTFKVSQTLTTHPKLTKPQNAKALSSLREGALGLFSTDEKMEAALSLPKLVAGTTKK